jgi:RNA polymerase sigma factor (sigma-70 family)
MSVRQVPAAATSEFDRVYQDLLPPVWRYVRSRVPDHHQAQDVTSDVFVRAWRSWPSYDQARGPARAFVFRIAQRAVADWWRGQRRQEVLMGDVPEIDLAGTTPEAAVIDAELLRAVRTAISALSQRERDVLALRYGADLRHAEVAEALETTPAAAKMLLGRTLGKLRDAVPACSSIHLMAAHRPAVPTELPARVRSCVRCERGTSLPSRHGGIAMTRTGLDTLVARFGAAPGAVLGWLVVGPVCIGCAVPAVWPLLASMGMFTAVGYWLHTWLLAAVLPVFAWILWRHAARHRDPWVMIIGGSGVALLGAHFILHFLTEGGALFDFTGRTGAVLLIVALIGNALALRRWLRLQRVGFVLAEG